MRKLISMLSVNNKIIQIAIKSNCDILQIINPDWRMSVLFPICQSLYWYTCHCCELFSCYMFFFPDVPDLINVPKQLLSPPVTFGYILHNFTKNSMVMEQEMQWNIMIKPLPLKFVVYLSKFVII